MQNHSAALQLFLHGLLSGKPLVLDENEEAQYFPGACCH